MADAIVIPIIGKDQASAALKAVRGQVVGLGDDAKESSGLLSKLGSGLASLGGTALKVAGAAGLGALAAAMGGLFKGVASNAEFEKFQTQFGVLLGSTQEAKQRLDELAKFGATTPFELPELVKADKVLTAFGLHSKDTAKLFGVSGDQILTTIGDVASGTGVSFEELSVTFGKFASGATGEAIARFQELGIATKEQMAQWGLEFSKSGQLLTPAREAFTILEQHVRDKFGGMMDAQSKTFEGMLSNLQDWAGQSLRLVSAPIFDVLKDKLASLLEFLNDPATQEGIKAFADSLAQGVGVAMDFVTNTAIPALISAWQSMQPAIATVKDLFDAFAVGMEGDGGIVGGFTNLLYALGPVSPLFDTIADGINTLADAFQNGALVGAINLLYQLLPPELAGQITEGLLAIRGIVADLSQTFTDAGTPIQGFIAVLSEVSPAFALLYGVASEIFPQLRALVLEIFGDISAYFEANGAEMLGQAQTTWQSIHDTILSLVQPIAEVVSAVLTQIAIFWQEHDDEIMAFVGSTWAEINSIIQTAMQLIQAIIVPILKAIATFINEHGAEIQAVLSAVWENIKAVIDITLAVIGGIIRTVLAAVKGDWSGAWEEIRGTVDRVWKDIQTIINNTLEPIKTAISNAWEDIKTSASTTWETIKTTVDTKLGELKAIITGIPGQLADVGGKIVQTVWDGVTGKWEEFMADMRAKLQSLRDMLPFSEPKDSSSPLYGLAKSGAAIIEMLATGVRQAGGMLPNAMETVGARTVDAAFGVARDVSGALTDSSLPDDAVAFGQYVMEGFIDGVQDKVDDALDVIDAVGRKIQEGFNDALELGSPPPWATDAGGFVMTGLLEGLEGGLPDLLSSLQQMGGALQAQMGEITEQLNGKLTDEARKALEAQRDSLQETVDAITDTVEGLGDKVHSALADAFDASADIDRQQMKNIDAVRRLSGVVQAETQSALEQALSEAQKIQDPEQAAKFFKGQSDHILELAKLTDSYYAAINSGDAEHAADLEKQIALAKSAQAAEDRAFGEKSQISSGGALSDLHDVLEQITNTVTDPGSGPLHDMIARLYDLQVRTDAATAPPGVPPQQMATAAPGASTSVVMQQGAIVINAMPGQNEQMIADMVMREIERRYQGRMA